MAAHIVRADAEKNAGLNIMLTQDFQQTPHGEKHPLRHHFPPFAGFRVVESSSYYGKGYQDVEHRKPSIRNAHRCLDWEPKIDMQETIDETLNFFLRTVDLTDKPS